MVLVWWEEGRENPPGEQPFLKTNYKKRLKSGEATEIHNLCSSLPINQHNEELQNQFPSKGLTVLSAHSNATHTRIIKKKKKKKKKIALKKGCLRVAPH